MDKHSRRKIPLVRVGWKHHSCPVWIRCNVSNFQFRSCLCNVWRILHCSVPSLGVEVRQVCSRQIRCDWCLDCFTWCRHYLLRTQVLISRNKIRYSVNENTDRSPSQNAIKPIDCLATLKQQTFIREFFQMISPTHITLTLKKPQPFDRSGPMGSTTFFLLPTAFFSFFPRSIRYRL